MKIKCEAREKNNVRTEDVYNENDKRMTRKRNEIRTERLSHQSFYVLRDETDRDHDQVLDSCFAQFL